MIYLPSHTSVTFGNYVNQVRKRFFSTIQDIKAEVQDKHRSGIFV